MRVQVRLRLQTVHHHARLINIVGRNRVFQQRTVMVREVINRHVTFLNHMREPDRPKGLRNTVID